MQLNLDFLEIASIVKGEVLSQKQKTPLLQQVATDSRSAYINSQSVFICLKGPRHDGHNHVQEVYKKGCLTFIVSEQPSAPMDANIILVKDTLLALQTIAGYIRKQIKYPLLAITGSNGKTVVKEWLYEVLSGSKNVYKSPKSYNSQIGVALSLLGLDKEADLGIIEAGISKYNEMPQLADMIRPNMGILTNIGTAHDAGFHSKTEKLEEKIRLFQSANIVVYNYEQELVHKTLQNTFSKEKLWSWGKSQEANVQVNLLETHPNATRVNIKHKQTDFLLDIPFTDHASLENVFHVVAAALYLQLPVDTIVAQVKKLKPLSMRLVAEEAVNGCILIDDSYSNDLESLKIALSFQTQQNKGLKKSIVLSDFNEHGQNDTILYHEVAQILKANQLNTIYLIGHKTGQVKDFFNFAELHHFNNTTQFLAHLNTLAFKNTSILIKGAREFHFEKIVKRLRFKKNETRLEINLQYLEHNLNYLKSKLKPKTKVMAMVKAYSYGAGSFEIAQFLSFNRADYLAVAYLDEGIKLRKQHIDAPIMVMNVHDHYHTLIEYDLEPEVYSISQLTDLIHEIGNKRIAIHLKLDVGMHRLGITSQQLPAISKLLLQHPNVVVKTIFSHLPSADVPELDDTTREQIQTFELLAKSIELDLGYPTIKHILNSAGAQRFPKNCADMVRLGIGLYGIGADTENQQHLIPIATLKTAVSSVRRVKKGEPIGYGGKGVLSEDGNIATIAIGYADGYDRRFSNGVGEVLIRGKRYPVVGNVCMDMCMIAVGNDDIQEGEEVIIFNEELPIYELANKIGTIPYELLTNISERVKRTYSYE